jgi:hypothetical protein
MPTPLSITSANAVYLISVAGVFPVAQPLQGWGVDEAFDTERADISETKLGVDGVFAAGWVPRVTKQTITLLAASPSFLIFEQWVAAQDTTQSIFYATGTIILPSIQRKYSLPNGVLGPSFQAIPNAKKVLADRQFEITWGWPITSGPS